MNVWKNFRTDRYYYLNELRWRLMVQTRISIENKIVFEPGAGVGDQTEWLLLSGMQKKINC